jgi:hypothetical protein
MNCLENLKICKGECCKYFVFTVELTEDLRNYYNMHENVHAIGNQVFILNKCKNLTKSGKCKIYGSIKRPKICQEGYTKIKEGTHCPEGCIYNESLDHNE